MTSDNCYLHSQTRTERQQRTNFSNLRAQTTCIEKLRLLIQLHTSFQIIYWSCPNVIFATLCVYVSFSLLTLAKFCSSRVLKDHGNAPTASHHVIQDGGARVLAVANQTLWVKWHAFGFYFGTVSCTVYVSTE